MSFPQNNYLIKINNFDEKKTQNPVFKNTLPGAGAELHVSSNHRHKAKAVDPFRLRSLIPWATSNHSTPSPTTPSPLSSPSPIPLQAILLFAPTVATHIRFLLHTLRPSNFPSVLLELQQVLPFLSFFLSFLAVLEQAIGTFFCIFSIVVRNCRRRRTNHVWLMGMILLDLMYKPWFVRFFCCFGCPVLWFMYGKVDCCLWKVGFFFVMNIMCILLYLQNFAPSSSSSSFGCSWQLNCVRFFFCIFLMWFRIVAGDDDIEIMFD